MIDHEEFRAIMEIIPCELNKKDATAIIKQLNNSSRCLGAWEYSKEKLRLVFTPHRYTIQCVDGDKSLFNLLEAGADFELPPCPHCSRPLRRDPCDRCAAIGWAYCEHKDRK
jgi:hypothetical protein